MPTIRDVVQTLGEREGVEAVLVLSRDGLAIDALSHNGVDLDGIAALVPVVAAACSRLGSAADCGGFGTGIVEYEGGMVIVAELTADALLAILFRPGTNIGSVLYELQRHRASIAGLL